MATPARGDVVRNNGQNFLIVESLYQSTPKGHAFGSTDPTALVELPRSIPSSDFVARATPELIAIVDQMQTTGTRPSGMAALNERIVRAAGVARATAPRGASSTSGGSTASS